MRRGNSSSGARLLFALLVAASIAPAQSTPQTANEKPASVEGVVINSLTREPLPRAHVHLRGFIKGTPQRFGALTNAEGKFSIAGLPPGQYAATAERVGFVTPAAAAGSMGNQIVLRPDDKKNDLKLKLTPVGAITGRVIDADGEPVEEATVTAEGGTSGGGSARASTDESGQFRIGGLDPGKYRIKAQPEDGRLPPEIRTDGTTEAHYAATYYPNSLAPMYAARVAVPAGGEVGGIEIRLVRVPIVRVSGTVSGILEGARNVSVMIRQTSLMSRQARSTNTGAAVKPDGSFQIWRLDPGKYSLYSLISTLGGPGGQILKTAPEEIEVGELNIDNIELRLVPSSDIPGHLEFDDEQAKPPQPSQQPPAQGKLPPPQLFLRELGGGSMIRAEIAADGSFRLEQVPPGRFRAIVTWGPAYVKSMRLGSTEMEGGILNLRYGSAGAALTVVVTSATGAVSGTVYDNKGAAAGAQVVLRTEDDTNMTTSVTAQADGTYSLSGLAPGKYWLAAAGGDANDSVSRMRAAGQEDYEDLMESIEIRANEKLSKDLKVRVPGEQ